MGHLLDDRLDDGHHDHHHDDAHGRVGRLVHELAEMFGFGGHSHDAADQIEDALE